MLNQVKDERVRNGDEPVNRVIEDFFLVGIQNEGRIAGICLDSPLTGTKLGIM